MTLKPLALSILAATLVSACVAPPKQEAVKPIVFTEPELSAPFYSLKSI